MKNAKLAARYATAFYELATENKKQTEFLTELTVISRAITQNKEISDFLLSPLVLKAEKEKIFMELFKAHNFSNEVKNFVLLLAKKDRISILPEIINSYQTRDDEEKKITRGTVRSAHKLSEDIKEDIRKSIEAAVQKKVVLQYIEDAALIGGLHAQVGSLTFDDSLFTHLNRINEDLTRRMN